MRRSALLFDLHNRPTSVFTLFLRDVQIPGDDLSTIDDALQQRFFQKTPDGQPLERWELKEVEVACSTDRIKQHLSTCGFMEKTQPNEKVCAYAAWPGALVIRAVARLNNLARAWEDGVRWEKTIVFGGKRPLQPDKEGYEACCKAIGIEPHAYFDGFDREDEVLREVLAPSLYLWHKMKLETELDMMRWLWEQVDMPPELRALPVTFVDAPMKPSGIEGYPPIRPNTEDTIREWLISNPAPGSILLSSGAPYGMAQDETFWKLLGPHGFTVTTFGHAAPNLPVESFMREVAGCVHQIRQARLGL
ncbi:MAG: hypothetical protein A3G57_03060 [Candidatus Andersenbacteria bacterium RIFCSPLOWO2_12_FULL_45_8]|nr:MAG: hypothetical protein UW94_C0002G0052 [Parcubacteria group bacterium GW2011_GWA2_45_14]OGY33518.1 MAG: hypothetical protein A3B76_05700 [Candidatus Andersenbacteria bacterium RIFCSPHIGHO2_02_FULL_46_16]OGY36336.1 MAG: hypothetical protein A3I08_04430 [Candidatus Andersenbacteria bacterium RIFCSPLOWO2_02_FULL_46_11]OGY39123.1 MAG: hypothetical protein A3G57_03060 [Candidatus Andersenbacteria bacterium RIFCSPLOWO2_12_FULL_45_8]HBE90326.1 hypothetical protein [Candidatus Andersenbacteria ba